MSVRTAIVVLTTVGVLFAFLNCEAGEAITPMIAPAFGATVSAGQDPCLVTTPTGQSWDDHYAVVAADLDPDDNFPGVSVGEFLTPDGQFDLEAARLSGYQGPLDLEGFQSALDPVSGQPSFRVSGTQTGAADPDDVYWEEVFPSIIGVDGKEVDALVVYNGLLVAGGTFVVAGDVIVNRVAAWNGTSWSAFGSGVNDTVCALTVYRGELIAAGCFTEAGGTNANRIARWDGTNWLPLGAGTDARVRALAVHRDTLVVGGSFINVDGTVTANRIARWDGTTWSAMGSGMDHFVSSLVIFQDRIHAGGEFSTAGGVTARGIAQWTGTSWATVGTGLNDGVGALTIYNNELVAGGWFTAAGGVVAKRIASWNGSTWSTFGAGMNDAVFALEVFDNNLIAGGTFTNTWGGGTEVSHIAQWNGSAWSPLGQGLQWTVNAFTVYDNKLFVGGLFTPQYGFDVNKIAAWDGVNWSSLGCCGLNYSVFALTVYRGDLYIGGGFTRLDDLVVNRIAKWDGTTWSALGLGLNDYVRELVVYNDRLIVVGFFTEAGGISANGIATWDGTTSTWSALGTGMTGGPQAHPTLSAVAVYNDQLIAAGSFSAAGGVAATNIATWNGAEWASLGSGIGNANSHVFALAVFNGNLIAGGTFRTAGGTSANMIASWNGTTWMPLGPGMTEEQVIALTVYDNQLIAGGGFVHVGDSTFNHLASWDGSTWSSLDSGISCYGVGGLSTYDNKLVAGGSFLIGGNNASIASWDGTTWSSLGSGVGGGSSHIRTLREVDDGLFVVGDFTIAGGAVSGRIAKWTKGQQPPNAVCQNVTKSADANCQAAVTPAEVDNGSSDPEDGTNVTLELVPTGPFAKGVTLVELIVTDTQGAKDTCDATVTVIDDTMPVADCPGDIIMDNDPGQSGAIVDWIPTVSDNCPGATIDCVPSPGSFFDEGTTLVTCLATDLSGNKDTCDFNVTITVIAAQISVSPLSLSFTLLADAIDSSAAHVENTAAASALNLIWSVSVHEVVIASADGSAFGSSDISNGIKASQSVEFYKRAPLAKRNLNILQSTAAPHTSIPDWKESSRGSAAILCDQTDLPGDSGFTSQNFEVAIDAYDNQGADDFVIPVSDYSWEIESVDVLGFYSDAGGPAASVNVWFYADAGGLPGVEVFSALNVVPGVGLPEGEFSATLSPPAILQAGTYWVSVQANQDFDPFGQWYWNSRTGQANAPSAWRNPGDGFGDGCIDWTERITCIPSSMPDCAFRLTGNTIAPECAWLSVHPTTGVVPPLDQDDVTVVADATGLAPGTYECQLVITSNDPDPGDNPITVPVTLTVVSGCQCPFQCDFDEDGFLTALDLSAMIDILFAGHPDVHDPDCPSPRADFDCDGFSTALDLANLIDHLFAGGAGPCEPCAP